MSAPIARGFNTLRDNSIVLSDWRMIADGESIAGLPQHLESWTMFTSIAVSVDMTVDIGLAIAGLSLHPTAQLGAVLRWRSDTTYVSGASEVRRLSSGTTSLQAEIDGINVGGHLRISVDVVLLEPGLPTTDPAAPRDRGALLWHAGYVTRLEGHSPQMPMVMVPFSKRFQFASGAVWHVDIGSADLHAPANAAFVVWLNAEHPAVEALADAEDSGRANILKLIAIGVFRRLIEHALTSFDADELEAEFEPQTFGSMLRGLLLLISPSVEGAHELHSSDRAAFELRLQSQIGSAL